MNKTQEKARNLLLAMPVGYYKKFAQDERFAIEQKIMEEIIAIVSSKQILITTDFQAIANHVNCLTGRVHYDGAVWYDFKIRLTSFFCAFGYESIWSITGEFIFRKVEVSFWRWLKEKLKPRSDSKLAMWRPARI